MKCMDCGRSVSNWPDWLSATTIEVRCSKCVGNGANVINAPTPSMPFAMAETPRQPEVTLKAA